MWLKRPCLMRLISIKDKRYMPHTLVKTNRFMQSGHSKSRNMQSLLHGVREYLTPVLTESSFEDKGLLTPEEFVKAGDLLVYKCPTWRWESGEPSLRRAYLPVDKQFLITRNGPN